jgi:flagellar motor switch protein FliN/FliY
MQLSDIERDAIGEILNISMGSAATAVSSMLDKQVLITTPQVSVTAFKNLDYSSLEPALVVKITYVSGITGSNIMVFRQRDMQLILNQLMGIEEPPSDDFVFDELSMSAASEVMNQMMGASATALSEFLGKTINISTPTAIVMNDDVDLMSFTGYAATDDIVSVLFDLTINEIMHSEFACVMSTELAKMLVGQFVHEEAADSQHNVKASTVETIAEPEQTSDRILSEEQIQKLLSEQNQINQTAEAAQMSNQSAAQTQPQQPLPQAQQQPAGFSQQPGQGYGQAGPGFGQAGPAFAAPGMEYQPGQTAVPPVPPGMPPYPNGYGYYPGYYPPYGYPPVPPMMPTAQPQQAEKSQIQKEGINVHNIKFPNFSHQPQPVFSEPINGSNMELIMNVPLNVSVEIGKTKKKIKDILDFSQGTVIELEKQAGAPVDIVVNGQLIARGDVVVIEDNFGVRVTEILGIKDILPGAASLKE